MNRRRCAAKLAALIGRAVSLTPRRLGSFSVLAWRSSQQGGAAEGPARRDTGGRANQLRICFPWQSRVRESTRTRTQDDNQSAHPTHPPTAQQRHVTHTAIISRHDDGWLRGAKLRAPL